MEELNHKPGKVVVFGASGRVGSALVHELAIRNINTAAVFRDAGKATKLPATVEVIIANLFDRASVENACHEASTIFILTPESHISQDVLGDARIIIENYRNAVEKNNALRVVALSSMGARHAKGTGNLEISYMLEQAFKDYDGEATFIRPGYYYSNWMGYLEVAKENGILPTFFPPELKIGMVSPEDIALFAAEVICGERTGNTIYEVCGPHDYSSREIAEFFSAYLSRDVAAIEIPKQEWEPTLLQVGFTPDAAHNLALMTNAVLEGLTEAEFPNRVIRMNMDMAEYLE